ncbi:hypothetical protein, partial [Succinivibrio sp.]|uniref:hypothetical protein n=1 Tax=Succinivibrio sp. TaxID=2053619 RepID=UPI003867B06D
MSFLGCNNYLKKREIIFCLGIFFYLFLLIGLFNISFDYIFKFLLLNIVSILLPGVVILSYTKLSLTRIDTFSLSYLLGYAFLIVEYFFSRLSHGFFSFSLINYVVL